MQYLIALHIIFIVTWFSGMFYIVRLFIYNTEAGEKDAIERDILRRQFSIMLTRLWYGITWPSAILTLIFGPWLLFAEGWNHVLFQEPGRWLLIKLVFVFFLYAYFLSLHKIFSQQMKGIFKYTSQQLRIWNELATIFLIAIVMIAVVKNSISIAWGLLGLALFIVLLMSAIKVYKLLRKK